MVLPTFYKPVTHVDIRIAFVYLLIEFVLIKVLTAAFLARYLPADVGDQKLVEKELAPCLLLLAHWTCVYVEDDQREHFLADGQVFERHYQHGVKVSFVLVFHIELLDCWDCSVCATLTS